MAVRIQALEQDGIVGEFHLPAKILRHQVAVFLVAGSSGGLRHRDVASRLAEDGIPALALAYFAHGKLPSKLHNIPLEYFFRAAQHLRAHPELCDASIVAMGSSRGGELVLQLASIDACFSGVIVTSPSHVRWGATGQAGAAWTFKGRALPFVQPSASSVFVARTQEVMGRSYTIYREWYCEQLKENPSVEAATIPVERINGPLLLFSGTDDQLWPSTLFADHIEARARANDFGYPISNVWYRDAGHIFSLPGQVPVLHAWHDALGSGIAYGGTADAVISAAADRWSRILSFIHKVS